MQLSSDSSSSLVVLSITSVAPKKGSAADHRSIERSRVVERPFAWLSRFRRLSKAHAYHLQSSGTMIDVTIIRLTTRRFPLLS